MRRSVKVMFFRLLITLVGMITGLVIPGGTLMLAAPVPHTSMMTTVALQLTPNQQAFPVRVPQKQDARRTKRSSREPVKPVDAVRVSRAFAANSNDVKPKRGPLLSAGQQSNLKLLTTQAVTRRGVEVYFDHDLGTPRMISGRPSAAAGGVARAVSDTPRIVARKFLHQNRALYKLENPDQELTVTREDIDHLGKRHVRLTQTHAGIPLWGYEVVVHLERDNSVYMVNGHTAPTPTGVDVKPVLTANQATQQATRHMKLTRAAKTSTQLVFYAPEGGRPTLAYKVDVVAGLDQSWQYFVDANSGTVLNRISNIHTAGSIVSASGTDLEGKTRQFNAWFENGTYYTIDPSTPMPDPAYDPLKAPKTSGDTYIYNAKNGSGRDAQYHNTSLTLDAGWDAAAVSAAFNTRAVYDYYKNTFGRNSLDGNGKNLFAVIHYQSAYANAFWNGESMVYGDGDNRTFGPLSKGLDVAAHEMTHGVIGATARLIYQNQSGALNESFADVFAAMIDDANWTLGETVTIAAPGFLRDMRHPARSMDPQPEHMSQYVHMSTSQDNGGVHVNSGIPNRAAYLIAEGLSAEGLGSSIGRIKTQQIYYRALTTYLVASAQFLDARHALIQAATDLHGADSVEVAAVVMAWDQVGVKEGDVVTPGGSTTSASAVPGSDIMVYLYPQDDTYDSAVEPYDVYRQLLAKPFNGYDQTTDFGPLNQHVAALTRPAVYTKEVSEAGSTKLATYIVYVGADGFVYRIKPDGTEELIPGLTNIGSVAISPDVHYLAYTTLSETDNAIHVVNLRTAQTVDYILTPPDYQKDKTTSNAMMLYADSVVFDYTGKKVLFDALNCMSIAGSLCTASGGGYRYWSIGLLDVRNGSQSYPLPNQNPAFDVGYPAFPYNSSDVIAVDVIDNSLLATTGKVASKVQVLGLKTNLVSTVTDYGQDVGPIWGASSFWGDDDFITVQYPVADKAIYSAKRIPINNQSWIANDYAAERLNNFAVAMPVMHRVGVRALQAALQADHALLDFGQLNPGQTRDLDVVITNTGNVNIDITNISLSSTAFSHNATNVHLLQGQSMTVRVHYNPAGQTGTQAGTLTFATVDEPDALSISLTGTLITPPPPSPPPASNNGGGGGAVNGWGLLGLGLLAMSGIGRRSGRNKH